MRPTFIVFYALLQIIASPVSAKLVASVVPTQYEGLEFIGAFVRQDSTTSPNNKAPGASGPPKMDIVVGGTPLGSGDAAHAPGSQAYPEYPSTGKPGSGTPSSNYYISIEKDTLPEAREACPRRTKGKGVLVTIETPEEDQEIHDLIRSPSVNKSGELFWTDGVCSSKGVLKWNAKNMVMNYTHFVVKPGPGSLVAFRSNSNNSKDYEWVELHDRMERNYFICKIEAASAVDEGKEHVAEANTPLPAPATSHPQPEPAPAVQIKPCEHDISLAIVIDHMNTLTDSELSRAREFARMLATGFPSPSNVFVFAYDNITQSSETTAPKKSPNGVSVRRGSKPRGAADIGIAKVGPLTTKQLPSKVVVITNGRLGIENLAAEQAERARGERVSIFAIGVGPNVNSEELLALADGKPENMVSVPHFDGLASNVEAVSTKLCGK